MIRLDYYCYCHPPQSLDPTVAVGDCCCCAVPRAAVVVCRCSTMPQPFDSSAVQTAPVAPVLDPVVVSTSLCVWWEEQRQYCCGGGCTTRPRPAPRFPRCGRACPPRRRRARSVPCASGGARCGAAVRAGRQRGACGCWKRRRLETLVHHCCCCWVSDRRGTRQTARAVPCGPPLAAPRGSHWAGCWCCPMPGRPAVAPVAPTWLGSDPARMTL